MQRIRFISNARRLMMSVAFVAVLLVLLVAPASAPTVHAAAQMIPVETLLNPDGTLNASTGARGTLDLRGWNVTLDSVRGPILTHEASAPAAPRADTWSALANNGLNGAVYAIAVSGSDLYVGGYFQQTADGTVTNLNNIAKYNTGTNTWSALANNGLNNAVHAFAVSGSDLYVGGDFTQTADGGITLNHIAMYSGGTWSALANNGLISSVYVLAVIGSDLYVGGGFLYAGDGMKPLSFIAKYSGGAWSALANNGLNGPVLAIVVNGSDLYVGGGFNQTADGTVINLNEIAKYNTGTNTWSALANNGLNGQVNAFAISGSDLYVGGIFTQTAVGGITLNNIAKYSGGAWSALANNGLSGGSAYPSVWALAMSGSDLYVGGHFTQTNDGTVTNLNYIAKYSGGAWAALGNNGLNGSTFPVVSALAVSGSNLYVGGSFTQTADGIVTNLNNIARPIVVAIVYAEPWPGTCGGNTPCYASLQGAINAVATGEEVRYYGGTYNESVSLNKNATLNFVGSSNVTINGALTISAGTFNAPSANTLSLTGNLTKSGGTFNPNGGTFAFTGSGTQTVSGNFTFNNLTVNGGATVDAGSNTLTVNGTLTNNGILKRSAPQQNVGGSPVTYTDAVGRTTVQLTSTGGTPLGNTSVVITANQSPGSGNVTCGSVTLGGSPVLRHYNITPTNTSGVAATVRLYFAPPEANGNQLSNIAIYHCNGTTWESWSSGITTGTDGTTGYNWVQLSNVTTFSPFGIGGGPGAPTAVTLSSFRANAQTFEVFGNLEGLGVLGIVALVGAGWVARRKKAR